LSKPAICIVAFNRPDSLSRLLTSISNAIYESNDIELVISIDYKENDEKNQETVEVAKNFKWKYGTKNVIQRKKNYGLKKHILTCGDMLLNEYESMIMLEDDIFVSPYFYAYSLQVLDFYKGDNLEKIAGFSLYNHRFNETASLPFEPIDDGYDNYFLQIPSSWGQMWIRNQWKKFKDWYILNKNVDVSTQANLPENIRKWSDKSWKKFFCMYVLENNKYFFYPRVSLTTNFGDKGTHYKDTNNLLQVSLINNNREYSFSTLKKSKSIYDIYCEIDSSIIKNFVKTLEAYEFEVDLYGTKNLNNISTKYLLSIKALKKNENAIYQYSYVMKPHEQNILSKITGSEFKFAKTSQYTNINKIYLDQVYTFMNIKNLKLIFKVSFIKIWEKIFEA
jgi:hypothetical protein